MHEIANTQHSKSSAEEGGGRTPPFFLGNWYLLRIDYMIVNIKFCMANYILVSSSTKKRINEEFVVVQCMQMANHNAACLKEN